MKFEEEDFLDYHEKHRQFAGCISIMFFAMMYKWFNN
jgi:hypothetical protein